MKKTLLFLFTLLYSSLIFAQANDFAVQSYKDAEEAFTNGKFEMAISNLDIAETMLKTTNPKIQGLKLKSFRQLALLDSVQHYGPYANYVNELKAKKSTVATDAAAELKNYPMDRAKFMADKKQGQLISFDNITIGQSFSSLNQTLYNSIDFLKPRVENQLNYYNLKSSLKELQTGPYEIAVDKNADKIVKLKVITYALSYGDFTKINMGTFYSEKLQKFDPNKITTETGVEKFFKTDWNVVKTRAKIDENTTYMLYFYSPIKVNYKDIQENKVMYYYIEGYEIN